MSNIISAKLDATGLRFAIIISRFNEFITSRLLTGARDALLRHNATDKNIDEVWVPGSWELPMTAKALAQARCHDAVICLGCVVRGQTSHHVYVANEATKGLAQVSLETGVPIGFGLLTTDTIEQAIERAGTKAGNKGADAALSAVEMVNLLREIGPKKKAR